MFFINLPLAVAVVVIAARHVPETRDPAAGRIDASGAAAITGGLVGLTYGLIAGPGQGRTSPAVLPARCAGTGLFAGFLLIEAHRTEPMLPLTVLRSRQFSAANTAANTVTFIVYAALGGVLFLLPIVLQQVAGYTPLRAGTASLPVTVIMLALSARSGALAARIGPRLPMTAGPLVIAAGLALFIRLGTSGSYLTQVLPAVVVFGLGLAINVAPLTATALAAAPAEHAGVASAVNNDVACAGNLIAVAVLPVLAGITGEAYLHPAALAHGCHTAVLLAAGTCAVGGLLAAATIPNPTHRRTAHPRDREWHCALDAPPLRGHHHAAIN